MIAIIRIAGMVDMKKDAESALFRLRLRRKYACVVLRGSKELEGTLKKIRSFVAYGEISKQDFVKLTEARGELADKTKKIDKKGAAEQYFDSKTNKKLSEFGIKPFFRLHPPVGGIKSKMHYPKGVLGNHGNKINKLIMRML